MTEDLARYREWIGRKRVDEDVVTPFPPRALAATFDTPDDAPGAGDPLPPAWHWLFFLDTTRASKLSTDGLPGRGDFLPPVPLPRRMWAGSRFEFPGELRVGDAAERVSTIESVAAKQGRSGPLVFVTVRHEVFTNGAATPALREWHDIVYRAARQPGDVEPPPQPAPADAEWAREWQPADVLLFRYSALTFNGHRIHYDRRYVTEVEGYPGLIVHGPLIATLLLDLLGREWPAARLASFAFKALRPSFDGHALRVSGKRDGDAIRLWAQDHEGWLTMDAQATLRAA